MLVYKDFFIGIKDFGFFTQIYINNKRIQIEEVQDFKVKSNGDDTVTYTFFIPFEQKLSDKVKMNIIFNDETIYTAFDEKLRIKCSNSNKISNLKIGIHSYYGIKAEFHLEVNDD